MIENFDYEKGQEFLNKTNQPLHILKGVNNINPIDYKQLLTNLTVKDDEYGLMSFIIVSLICCVSVAVTALSLGLTKEERRFIYNKINKHLRFWQVS